MAHKGFRKVDIGKNRGVSGVQLESESFKRGNLQGLGCVKSPNHCAANVQLTQDHSCSVIQPLHSSVVILSSWMLGYMMCFC